MLFNVKRGIVYLLFLLNLPNPQFLQVPILVILPNLNLFVCAISLTVQPSFLSENTRIKGSTSVVTGILAGVINLFLK